MKLDHQSVGGQKKVKVNAGALDAFEILFLCSTRERQIKDEIFCLPGDTTAVTEFAFF